MFSKTLCVLAWRFHIRFYAAVSVSDILVGGLEHFFYFPFHIWDVILPIDELIFFKMVKLHHQPVFVDGVTEPDMERRQIDSYQGDLRQTNFKEYMDNLKICALGSVMMLLIWHDMATQK